MRNLLSQKHKEVRKYEMSLKILKRNSNHNNYKIDELKEIFNFWSNIKGCNALKNKDELMAACKIVEMLKLPSHHDIQKNWDTIKSLYYIIGQADPESPILDAGSSADSVILQWLSLLEYKSLHACDIRNKGDKYPERKIKFSVQDLTKTDYPGDFFKAITSISVIEHGVDLCQYLKEMQRILKKDGLLLTSTDYWSDHVDCSGIYPYGKEMGEMKVFTPQEIEHFCDLSQQYGFKICNELDLSTQDKVVKWERVNREYTFFFIALKKL